MLKPFTIAFSGVALMAALIFTGASAHASSARAVETGKVLDIIPVCSDASKQESYWNITNENADSAHLEWNNVENNHSGDFDAVNGTTQLVTYYNPADPNNRTEFIDPNHDVPISRNAQVAPCQPVVTPAPVCTDGHDQSNLEATKLSASSYSIKTKNGLLLCADVTIYLSSYILPANYDGTGFGGPTSYPQQIFDSTSVVLKKDTLGEATLSINLPPSCKAIQVDLYYAPEILTVGASGHSIYFIAGEIYNASGVTCQGNGGTGDTPTTPTTPVTPVVPTTPTTPVVVPDDTTTTTPQALGRGAAVSELPETGASTPAPLITIMMALALGMFSYALTYKLQNQFRK